MGLGTLDVHAGDFARGKSSRFAGGRFLLKSPGSFIKQEEVPISQLKSFEVASEEAVKRFGGSLVGAGLGSLAFGSAGLLAGALSGGTGKNVTFLCEFQDGRKMMATTDSKTMCSIQAEYFDYTNGSGKYRQNPTQGARTNDLKKARWVAIAVWFIGALIVSGGAKQPAAEDARGGILVFWTLTVVACWYYWKRKRC